MTNDYDQIVNKSQLPMTFRNIFRALICLLMSGVAPAWGQQAWVVTTVDFKTQVAQLRSISGKGVVVLPEQSTQEKTWPWDDLLQLQRPTAVKPAAAMFVLQMANGDRLTGQPVGYADEQIQWQHPLLGQMRLPLKEARLMLRGGQRPARFEQSGTEDVIGLANGDSIKGLVISITDRTIMVSTAAGDAAAPLEAVQWVSFAPTGKPQGGPAAGSAARQWRLGLADSSLVIVNSLEVVGDTASFTAASAPARQLSLVSINSIEQLNGPVIWLSSQPPAAMTQRPFFGALTWPAVMDATVSNHPIQFAGRTYQRGIGVHAYARLDYALDGSYKVFRTQYAIAADLANQYADLTVRVRVDDKVVYVQEHVIASKLYPVLLVELPSAARQLSLEVDYGGGGDVQGHLNWIEPALLRQMPALLPGAVGDAGDKKP